MAAVTDWARIYAQQFKKRANEQYRYDCSHGLGAYTAKEKQECEELHDFFVKFEQKNCSKKLFVEFIG